MAFYVYILASRRNGTLYTGSADDLSRRVWEHKQKAVPGFTADYAVDRLVWWESHETRAGAFARERRIKTWRRAWKLELIERANPDWRDLLRRAQPRLIGLLRLDLGPRFRGDARI